MNIQLFEDRVLIERVEADTKTAGGLIIPDNAKEKPLQGKVKVIGPGKRLDNGDLQEIPCQVDDIVWYSQYAGTELTVNGEKYIILRSSDLIGKQTK